MTEVATISPSSQGPATVSKPTTAKPIAPTTRLQPPQTTTSNNHLAIKPAPQVIKTSKDWVLPPRPKPGRKLKEKESGAVSLKKSKKSPAKSKKTPSISTSTSTSTSTNTNTVNTGAVAVANNNINAVTGTPRTPKSHSNTSTSNTAKTPALSSDISTISALLKNISIIDAENNQLKSSLLCLIHEYKHLKQSIFDPSYTTPGASASTTTTTAAASTTTTSTGAAATAAVAVAAPAVAAPASLPITIANPEGDDINRAKIDSQVHKRSYDEYLMLSEGDKIVANNHQQASIGNTEVVEKDIGIDDTNELSRLLSPAAPHNMESDNSCFSTKFSTSDNTAAGTPQPFGNEDGVISEFDEFIKMDDEVEREHSLKRCKTNDDAQNRTTTARSRSNSNKFNYKSYKRGGIDDKDEEEVEDDDEEESDLDINFDEEDEHSSLSRTTSPYSSDYENNSIMSTLTRSTTVSSVGTVVHDKSQLHSQLQMTSQPHQQSHQQPHQQLPHHNVLNYSNPLMNSVNVIHPPPMTLKKMGTFFDLPKYEENSMNKPYKFQFDSLMGDCGVEKKRVGADGGGGVRGQYVDDAYYQITDYLAETSLNNHLSYYDLDMDSNEYLAGDANLNANTSVGGNADGTLSL